MGDEGGVEPGLDLVDAAFGRDDLLLVFLEFLGDVAFGAHEGLFADPLRRDFVPEGVADLDIVAENVVVSDFERGDSGAFGLPLLHLQEIILPAAGQAAELVQLFVHPLRDDRALADLGGRLRIQGVHDFLQDLLAAHESLHEPVHGVAALAHAVILERLHLCEAAAQLQDLPREGLAVGDPPEDAVQVAELPEFFLHGGEGIRPVHEELHDVVPQVQFLPVQDGHRQPAPEHPRAHRRGTAVHRLHQGHAFPARCGLEHFQVAEGEGIHPDHLGFVDAAEGGDVAEARMLRLLQIDHQGPGGADSERHRVHGESLQGVHAELPLELFHRGVIHEGPFVQARHVIVAEAVLHAPLVTSGNDQFLGRERAHEGADVLERALRHLELSRGHIQESGAAAVAVERQPAQEVVLLDFQHVLAEGDARRDDLRHPALDEFLGEFRILQLVADGHLEARPDQFREVVLDGVVREAGHGDGSLVAVGFLGLHQSQHAGSRDGVVRVGLVKVADPVQQQRLGVLCLHFEKLFDQRGVFRQFRHLGASKG